MKQGHVVQELEEPQDNRQVPKSLSRCPGQGGMWGVQELLNDAAGSWWKVHPCLPQALEVPDFMFTSFAFCLRFSYSQKGVMLPGRRPSPPTASLRVTSASQACLGRRPAGPSVPCAGAVQPQSGHCREGRSL